MPLARDFRAAARNRLKGFWGAAILVCLVAMLLGGIQNPVSITSNYDNSLFETNFIPLQMNGFPIEMDTSDWPMISAPRAAFSSFLSLWGLAAFIVGGAVELGVCTYFSRTMLGDRPPFSALFDRFHIFGKALGLRLFMYLFIFLWALLLVIPGIVAAYRYSMAPYLMAEYPEMGIREAVDRSKQMMQGRKGNLFCLQLSFIGWALLIGIVSAPFIFGIGIWSVLAAFAGNLLLNPYIKSSEAAFYLHCSGRALPGAGSGSQTGNAQPGEAQAGNPYAAQPDSDVDHETETI